MQVPPLQPLRCRLHRPQRTSPSAPWRQCLNGLPQPHVVANQASPGPGSEERPLPLVGIEGGLEQRDEEGAVDFLLQFRLHHGTPVVCVLMLGNERHHVVAAAGFVAGNLDGKLGEGGEFRPPSLIQRRITIEQLDQRCYFALSSSFTICMTIKSGIRRLSAIC